MAEKSGNMILIVAVLGIAAVGGFLLMRKKGLGSPLVEDMPPEEAGGKFWNSLPLAGTQTSLTNPLGGALTSINANKVGVPITGGTNFDNAGAYSPLEAGNCQCDDKKCYYYQPFYAKTGGEQTGYGPARKSTAILWGDKVSACERLLAEFELESYQYDKARSNMAYAMRSRAAARFVASRMARTGLVR